MLVVVVDQVHVQCEPMQLDEMVELSNEQMTKPINSFPLILRFAYFKHVHNLP